jgi:hypothetical protein
MVGLGLIEAIKLDDGLRAALTWVNVTVGARHEAHFMPAGIMLARPFHLMRVASVIYGKGEKETFSR